MLQTWLDTAIGSQRRNWPSWLAILFGAGIAVYFGVPREPSLILVVGTLLSALLTSWVWRHRPVLLLGAAAVSVVAAGLLAAQLRASAIETKMLDGPVEGHSVRGQVDLIELLATGQRITLRHVEIEEWDPERTPHRVRVTARVNQPELRVGQWVEGSIDLAPPSPPFAPGAYDFRRDSYFKELGATGFAFGRLRIIDGKRSPEEGSIVQLASDRLSDLRNEIARRIKASLDEEEAAIAIALTVGDQTAIPKRDLDAMRDSGLAHLLSISGLHISLAAGLVFFVARSGLALVPALALNYPIKKWAAVAAFSGAVAYALLAGWTTPTQRSLVMAGIVFLAIVVDRSPISQRAVAWAAVLVLLIQPESLVGASFQMSFAAVFMLVVAFERLGPWFAEQRQRIGGFRGGIFAIPSALALWIGATAMTSLIAGLATLPFAIQHFDRVSNYGVIANALAVPLTGFWVMPCAVLALLAMPFGLEAYPLAAMGWGCDLLLDLARNVAAWPGAVTIVPAPPSWALIGSALGLIALGLGPRVWRWLGVLPICAGIASAWLVDRPDILISPNGELLAFRSPENELVLSDRYPGKIVSETWLRRNGQERAQSIEDLTGDEGWLTCGVDHCHYRSAIGVSAVLSGEVHSRTQCDDAAILIVPLGRRAEKCSGQALIIDADWIRRRGATAIYLHEDGFSVESVGESDSDRPWSAYTQSDQ